MIDPLLAGFEETWEPARVIEILDRILELEPGYRVLDLTLDRIRHSPGSRGIVHYRGHLGDGPHRHEFWIAGSIYSDGRGIAQYKKLTRHHFAFQPGLRSLVAFDSFLGMLWQVFPLDRRLPGLRQVWSDPSLLGAGSMHPVRHRLGLGATVKIGVGGETRYVKFHPQGEAAAALDRAHMLARTGVTFFALPEEVSGLEATITSETKGVSLDRHHAVGETVEGLASQLAALHATPTPGLSDVSTTPARRGHRAANWLRLVLPDVDPLITKLVERPWPEGGDEFVHGDLKPDHLFIADGEFRMIDVDSAGRGRGLSDLAQLFVRLTDRDAAGRVRDEYFHSPKDCNEARWSGEVAMASLQFALFQAQHRPPDWRPKVEEILELALTEFSS